MKIYLVDPYEDEHDHVHGRLICGSRATAEEMALALFQEDEYTYFFCDTNYSNCSIEKALANTETRRELLCDEYNIVEKEIPD